MKVLVSFPGCRHELVDSESRQPINEPVDDYILHNWDVLYPEHILPTINKHGNPKYIFTDGMATFNTKINDLPVYAVDAWLENEMNNFVENNIIVPTHYQTKHCANFVINKKQINRWVTIKLCEIFNVDYDYTWSGIGKSFDLSLFINEKQTLSDNTLDEYWDQILPSVTTSEKWIDVDGDVTSDLSHVNYISNTDVWNSGLNDIMTNTAVSLITESLVDQNAATFSEKTVFALYGLTFPIWVGGVNMATEWENKGFDIFNDVIDHSYQSMPTLLERCFYAIYLNREILTDINLAKELRNKMKDRLFENQCKLTPEIFKNYNRSVIETWPVELQEPALRSMYRYLNLK